VLRLDLLEKDFQLSMLFLFSFCCALIIQDKSYIRRLAKSIDGSSSFFSYTATTDSTHAKENQLFVSDPDWIQFMVKSE
jgi:hypothetical protein